MVEEADYLKHICKGIGLGGEFVGKEKQRAPKTKKKGLHHLPTFYRNSAEEY